MLAKIHSNSWYTLFQNVHHFSILSLTRNSKDEATRAYLQVNKRELKEVQEKEKNENIECMKQGPAENMTISVCKTTLKR